jgi:anti-anti-sigma factor
VEEPFAEACGGVAVVKQLGEVSVSRILGVPVAEVRGEVDLSNAGPIGLEIRRGIANDDPGAVVDLSALTYLDSSGVRLLFELEAQLSARRQRLCIAVPPEVRVRDILRITRVHERVAVRDTVPEAVAAVLQGPAIRW